MSEPINEPRIAIIGAGLAGQVRQMHKIKEIGYRRILTKTLALESFTFRIILLWRNAMAVIWYTKTLVHILQKNFISMVLLKSSLNPRNALSNKIANQNKGYLRKPKVKGESLCSLTTKILERLQRILGSQSHEMRGVLGLSKEPRFLYSFSELFVL